ncbi:MAG: protein kinase [Acidobacteria bacterium]|nr:protein kinase [Acidobacteriota bacterium]
MLGQTISHYQVLEKLGEGGMGVVYKAKDTHLGRLVAIKVLPAERVANPERKRRFIQEAKAASALNHPNIVTIHEIACEDGRDFIVMEYVAGKTLDQLIGRKGLKLSETLKYSIQMADALAVAHAAGIVHRDLKPANVMVTEKGLVKVLDFGLAKLTESAPGDEAGETLSAADEAPHTEEGAILGTVAYMSPEQAEGKKVDARSDIFSFGSLLYEVITGRRAFRGETKVSTLSAILKEEPPPPSSVAEDVPRDLEKIVARCLRKDPGRRFQHMDDVKIALEELKEESDSGKLTTVAPAQLAAAQKPPNRLLAAGLLALGLALIGAGVWLRVFHPGVTGGPPPRVVPLTSYPGLEIQPAMSPDGKQVAFAWNGEKEDNFDIYVKLVDAGTPLRLTTNPQPDYCPAWSPDGRYIAFLRWSESGAQVYVIPALGGSERKLAQTAAIVDWTGAASTGYRLSWSPDGKSLAIVDRGGPKEPNSIYLLSTETREKRRLTSPPADWGGDVYPALSPDGLTLAFVRMRTWTNFDIYLLSLADGKPSGEARRLTFDERRVTGLDWTPDGRSVVFSSDRSGAQEMWKIASAGGQPERLAFGDGLYPSISRDGQRLAFARSISDYNIWRVRGPRATEKGTPPTKLIASTQSEYQPQFSPDGKRVVFSSNRSGSSEVWVCDSEGLNAVQLTSFGGPHVGSPRWSPDDRWIAFDSTKEGHRDIYVVSVEGGAPRRLTTEPSDEVRPSWSKDGRWIYFGSNRSGDWQIWKAPAEGGTAIQVTKKGGWEAFEASDGKFLYCTKYGADGIWRVPVEGGEETQVLGQGRQSYWAVSNEGLCFHSRTAAGAPVIRFYSFATGRLTDIAELPKASGYLYPAVSPDGKWILYTQLDRVDSDLMLVENFR